MFEADYVNHNNHRKHTNHSNNCVSMPTRILSHFRNDSNVSRILRTKLPYVIWFDIPDNAQQSHSENPMLNIRLWMSSGYQHG